MAAAPCSCRSANCTESDRARSSQPTGAPVPRRRGRAAAGTRDRRPGGYARRPRGSRRRPAPIDHRRAAGRPDASAHPRSRRSGRALARHARSLRSWSAAGHLRRLGRGQVLAARHDRALHDGRRQRHRPGRGARPRSARVHRARPRRCAGPLGRRRRHLRPAGARPHPGGVHRDRDRRALPRPGTT